MQYIIDRLEGELAICEGEDRTMTTLPRAMLPEGCGEGSKIEPWEGGWRLVDNTEDKIRVENKLRSLFNRKPGSENAGEVPAEGESL